LGLLLLLALALYTIYYIPSTLGRSSLPSPSVVCVCRGGHGPNRPVATVVGAGVGVVVVENVLGDISSCTPPNSNPKIVMATVEIVDGDTCVWSVDPP